MVILIRYPSSYYMVIYPNPRPQLIHIFNCGRLFSWNLFLLLLPHDLKKFFWEYGSADGKNCFENTFRIPENLLIVLSPISWGSQSWVAIPKKVTQNAIEFSDCFDDFFRWIAIQLINWSLTRKGNCSLWLIQIWKQELFVWFSVTFQKDFESLSI